MIQKRAAHGSGWFAIIKITMYPALHQEKLMENVRSFVLGPRAEC